MTKARDLADLISTGNPLADGAIAVAEVTGAAPLASPTFTGDVTLPDKIVHTGDTNTAIRFPADDTIAFETAGSERFRFASAGQLGIAGANYGTSGQVLQSGGASGAASWADPGGGAFEVLSDTTFSSTGDKEYTVTAGKLYKFEFLGITVDNTIGGSSILWRASANGGSSFLTVYYSVRRSYSSATSFSTTNGNGSFSNLTYFNVPQSNANSGAFTGEMFYYQRSGYPPFANALFQNGDTTPGTTLGGYRVGTTSTVNLLRLQPNSDNISGRIRVLRSV